jgi:phosphoribosylformylglycinamidine synthase
MKFTAEVDVMPLKALLDPQGRAVGSALKNMGYDGVDNVRIGKHITLEVDAENEESAKAKIDDMCRKLLSNQVMESYSLIVNAKL